MNVAIFTDNDFDKVNGVTTTLSAALVHTPPGMRLRVYTAATLAVDDPQYLALRAIGMPIPFYSEMRMYVPPWRKLVEHARRDHIDLIHLTTPGPMGLAAMYVASRLSVRMVGSFHTDLAAYTATLSGSKRLGALMREYMRWPYGKCTRVLVPSEATKQTLIGAKGDPAKMVIWTRGVDTELFSPAKRSQRLRDEWHVSDKRPALLFVGRVSREKGLDLLAPVSRRLHAMGVEHRWIIAGEGPMSSELQRTLPDAFFTGVLSRQAVAEAFASADLFVFPSRTDTAGNVVLEAQACGLPVVVSDAGGPRENMIPGTTGVIGEGTAAELWAEQIADLLRSPSRRLSMQWAAREYALTRQWSRALEPLYRTYQEVSGWNPQRSAA